MSAVGTFSMEWINEPIKDNDYTTDGFCVIRICEAKTICVDYFCLILLSGN